MYFLVAVLLSATTFHVIYQATAAKSCLAWNTKSNVNKTLNISPIILSFLKQDTYCHIAHFLFTNL